MNPKDCPGPGDLMPIYAGHPHDPRTPEADDGDDVDQCQDLIAKIRAALDMAETALFRRDMETLCASLEKVADYLEDALA